MVQQVQVSAAASPPGSHDEDEDEDDEQPVRRGTRHLPTAEPTPSTRMPPRTLLLAREGRGAGSVGGVAEDVPQDVAQD